MDSVRKTYWTNMKIKGFVTVRTSSTRLPNKCLLQLGEENILSSVILRSIKYNIEPIVCTSIDHSDDIIEEISQKLKVKCYRGSLKNKLKRWSDCAEYFNIKEFHTIDADDPFFDGNEMIFSMKKLVDEGLDIVLPTISSSNGGASVGYSIRSKILTEALKDTDDSTDTEMIWDHLKKIKSLKYKTLEETKIRPDKLRLTLDFKEDYLLLRAVKNILGDNLSREHIDKLFINNPDLHKINWFRNKEWKQNQKSNST